MYAILALCSAAGAAPITSLGWNNDSSSLSVAVIGHDLEINQDAAQEQLPEEPEIALVTTSIDRDAVLSEKELANRDPAFIGVPASELPPVTTIALGFTFLGAAGIMRRTRTEKRRSRRRRTLVHMRAIIAPR
jgi:hypothetical protein